MDPIFVHASPRGGSTYFFAVLRRIKSLMCYNEAIIDVFGYYGKEGIAGFKAGQKWNVNHHFLADDDFAEIVEAWDSVMHLYPMFPSYQQYLPAGGILPEPLRNYLGALMDFARGKNKRPVLCEVHSRGRAGALRHAFGGFHIAQYRDPLSQFGSFFRPLPEGGQWNFLAFPLLELGISGDHPLYQVVPPAWRLPVLPWPDDDRAARWASANEYMAFIASPQPDALENVFRWHMFSWFLSNLAAISYSDMTLDLDRAHEDADYRRSVVDALAAELGTPPDFSDLERFSRYTQFDGLDMAKVCGQVVDAVSAALADGRLERAIATLGRQAPTVPVKQGVDLLLNKIALSQASLAASTDSRHVGVAEWRGIVKKNRTLWFNPVARGVAKRVYPLGAPLVRAARRAGLVA